MALSMDLGKTSARGSSRIFLGMVISNAILAVGSIVVGRLLGSALYGLYYLSSVPANLLGLCLGFGIRNGVVRYSARFGFRKDNEKVKAVVASGMLSIAVSSSIAALFSFFLSGWLADLFGRSYARSLIEAFSLTVPANALLVASQSVFVGLDKTEYYSTVMVFQAVVKTAVSPTLILLGLGAMGAALGQVAASYVACVLGVSIVYSSIIRKIPSGLGRMRLLSNLKMLITFGFPLYIRNLVTIGVQTHFLNFLVAIYASDVLIGNYKAATNFQVLLSFFAVPISTILLPSFSKLKFESDPESTERMFVASVKYTSLFIVPATALIIVLSETLISTFYGQTYTLASLYLSLSALIFLYPAFGQHSIPAFLSSQGETKKSMILGLVNAALVVSLALVLIPRLQIVGLIISLVFSQSPTIILGSWWIKKLYGFSIDRIRTMKILGCSLVAGIITFAVVESLALSNALGLSAGLLIFFSSILTLAPLVGAFTQEDISTLRALFSETGRLFSLMEIPFKLLSKSCMLFGRKKDK